ncbi:MAG: hypothetical protein CME67_04540 [Halobacteriovoraceae bacterium]|nr:hypothetical protein [Halobacteriovoraceae bacterium]
MTWGRRKDLKIIDEQDLEQLPFNCCNSQAVLILIIEKTLIGLMLLISMAALSRASLQAI